TIVYSNTMHSDTTYNATGHDMDRQDSRQMRIGELASAAGVTRETIHFYLREGLLPPPQKINARVAYFDDGHLARLRLIKSLQQVHLPLSAIREHLEYVKERSPEFVNEHFLPRLQEFLGLNGDETELSRTEIAEQTGLTLDQIARLEALG